ncbi:MAG: heat-inducible transcriptional repressor HrcA [Pseudomonadota bacterium]
MAEAVPSLGDLNERSREIFRHLVETYLETGEPVGSRTLSRALERGLSAATIRNVMQDLEHLGLLDSPHVSAGRVPTQAGLRLFIDGVLEIGDVDASERTAIERSLAHNDASVSDVLDQAGAILSGLSQCASIVFAPKHEAPVKHLEFLPISGDQVLAVMVKEDGSVENRLFVPPPGLTPSAMQEAANFLNAHLRGRTLTEAFELVTAQIASRRSELDTLAASLVERGIAVWDQAGDAGAERLIVRGRANLLDETQDALDLERMRLLFDDLEKKRDLAHLLDLAESGDGVRVFIGSENKLFSLSGSSLVLSPYQDGNQRTIGAIGVIGPTRLNYGRIVPIVDYTARLVGQMVSARGGQQTRNRGG